MAENKAPAGKPVQNAISPSRTENFPEWYQQVVQEADMAENSPTRGCMVIKPWGYAIWEKIQRELDYRIKKTGHKNAYFPLLIPLRFFEKEAQHAEGFAKECAVVTHSRLEMTPEGKLRPASALEEPLIVRPTSEMIIGDAFSRWVQSYRDLPLLINQWANVMRWEMRTRLFLRTSEFLWQEGHTAHASKEEAWEETVKMLGVYKEFCATCLAMPMATGPKPAHDRFAGAEETLAIEGMMQDGKALQAGTSHYMGQNFAKACDIKYLNDKGETVYAYTTSWGVTTRLIGGMIMTHGDDDGIIVPPAVAPVHAVILPVLHKEETRAMVIEACQKLKEQLESKTYGRYSIEVEIDQRDLRGGEKYWGWVKKGVPYIIEVGPRDIEKGQLTVASRIDPRTRVAVPTAEFVAGFAGRLEEINSQLLQRAAAMRRERTQEINSLAELEAYYADGAQAGWALVHWCGEVEALAQVEQKYKLTVRCLSEDTAAQPGVCIFTGRPSPRRVVLARAY